jgi:TatD DNase family protein
MLTDAHAHLPSATVLEVLKQFNIYTLACGTEPRECEQLRHWSKICPQVIPTYGLHPWKTGRFNLSQMTTYLHECPIIGEIGLDSHWAKVPLSVQEPAFRAQLDIAEQRRVPVILHTKGQERQIASIISKYSIPFLVHWYSCPHSFDLYASRDCYFSVGPAIFIEKDVEDVAREVRLDRLLIETDGIANIEWLRGKRPQPLYEIPKSLRATMEFVAKMRKVEVADLRRQVNDNFWRFAGLASPSGKAGT